MQSVILFHSYAFPFPFLQSLSLLPGPSVNRVRVQPQIFKNLILCSLVYPAAFCIAVLQFPLLFHLICGKFSQHWGSTSGCPSGNNYCSDMNTSICMYGRSGTGECCCRCYMWIHQVRALFYVKSRHNLIFETETSNRRSNPINRCVFTCRTILPNFIPIPFETMEPLAFLKRSPQQEKQFLI